MVGMFGECALHGNVATLDKAAASGQPIDMENYFSRCGDVGPSTLVGDWELVQAQAWGRQRVVLGSGRHDAGAMVGGEEGRTADWCRVVCVCGGGGGFGCRKGQQGR